MPTYVYQCDDCGRCFEEFQKMSDPPVEVCGVCGGKVSRLIGAGAAVIVKGSGSRSAGYRTSRPSCGRDSPCCGRDTQCEAKPCDE